MGLTLKCLFTSLSAGSYSMCQYVVPEHSNNDNQPKDAVGLQCSTSVSRSIIRSSSAYFKLLPAVFRTIEIQRPELPQQVERRSSNCDKAIEYALSVEDSCTCEAQDEQCGAHCAKRTDAVAKADSGRPDTGFDVVLSVLARVDCVVVQSPSGVSSQFVRKCYGFTVLRLTIRSL